MKISRKNGKVFLQEMFLFEILEGIIILQNAKKFNLLRT